MKVIKVASIILLITALSPTVFATAPTPELVTGGVVEVTDPQTVHAYYGALHGEPHRYRIESAEPFTLSLRVIMPEATSSKRDISFAVLEADAIDSPIAIVDGIGFEWVRKSDKNAAFYLAGPSWKEDLAAGIYEVRVWSGNNDSPYGLIIGEAAPRISAFAIFISLLVLAALMWGVWLLVKKGRAKAREQKAPLLEKVEGGKK